MLLILDSPHMTTAPDIYAYPEDIRARKHGPLGYSHYDKYRDWLRDEFEFRCVFCLRRETWSGRVGVFHLDHQAPRSAGGGHEYSNLLYVCAACNLIKGGRTTASPERTAFNKALKVNGDGTIEALTLEGQRIIRELRLDSPDHTSFRRRKLADLRAFMAAGDVDSIKRLCGYPDDLPDLRRKSPPGGNIRPKGVGECYFVQREEGRLAELY